MVPVDHICLKSCEHSLWSVIVTMGGSTIISLVRGGVRREIFFKEIFCRDKTTFLFSQQFDNLYFFRQTLGWGLQWTGAPLKHILYVAFIVHLCHNSSPNMQENVKIHKTLFLLLIQVIIENVIFETILPAVRSTVGDNQCSGYIFSVTALACCWWD